MSVKTTKQILDELTAREKSKLVSKIVRGHSIRPWLKNVCNISKGMDPNAPWDKSKLGGRTQTIKSIAFDLLRARFDGKDD